MALEFEVGDIVELNDGCLVYLQHNYKSDDKKWGVTVSKQGTPWSLIGGINQHLIGDGVIDDITKFPKVDKKEYIKKYGEFEKSEK